VTTPEADPADVAEQHASLTGDAARPAAPELPAEADVADVVEQAAAVGPGEHVAARDLPAEADEADAAEQAVVVELDDEAGDLQG
jgi:hypothetical protein